MSTTPAAASAATASAVATGQHAITLDDLLVAGAHFGHKVSRWNPKMRPFIYGKRNQIHIINLKQTLRGLIKAQHFLQRVVAQGGDILFVGTKRQVKGIIKATAQSVGMHYVNERWLGGSLTNYATILGRLKRLEQLENLEREGQLQLMSKKEVSAFAREKRRLVRNLEGIRHMQKLPSAVVVVDPKRENIAIRECMKTRIPSICVIDTDGDPDVCDICIPANDDALRSVQVILAALSSSIQRGKGEYDTGRAISSRGGSGRPAPITPLPPAEGMHIAPSTPPAPPPPPPPAAPAPDAPPAGGA